MSGKLQQAINAIQTNDKATARRLLTEILQSNPRNEEAWLWMARATDSDDYQQQCFRNVLKINPDNETAQQGIAALQSDRSIVATQPQEPAVATTKEKFPDLSYRAFQHPLDREALKALEKVRFLDTVVRKFSEWFSEKNFRLLSVSNNIRLGSRQCPSIYNKFIEVATILDIPKLPEVYVDSTYTINAYAYGMENYTITLCSGLIDMLTEDELLAVIGHELGHIKCNHMLYKTMAFILAEFGSDLLNSLLPMGIGMAATMGIQLAIYQWYRMAEYSCDRAALLVVQDPSVVANALTKLAGYSRKILPELNMEEVLLQASEYEETSGALEKTMKLFQIVGRTHPMPVVRAKEIMQWSQSDEYQEILAGNYLTMTDELSPRQTEQPTGPVCPNCNTVNPEGYKFCYKCRAKALQKDQGGGKCPQCHAVIRAGAKFCFKCGAQL